MAATGATLIIILIVNGELASCGNQVEIPCVTDFPVTYGTLRVTLQLRLV